MVGRLTTRPMSASDWSAVRAIYLEGIATQNATFEQFAPEWSHWDASHLPVCRFVATRGRKVVGWIALSRVSARPVYAGIAEVSLYVARTARRAGVGRALMARLIRESECGCIWSLRCSIFPENAASLALCARFGFRRVGFFEKVAQMNDRWRDTVLLERRSPVVGISAAAEPSSRAPSSASLYGPGAIGCR